MTTRRILAWLTIALILVLAASRPAIAAAQPAAAHPLGNFSVNRYDGVIVARDEIRIDHVEDLAEIPTAQVKPRVDRLGPAAWAAERCAAAVREMELAVDQRPGELRVRTARAQWRPGQAGLPTLRVECAIVAAESGRSVVFRGVGGTGDVGWREITARGDRMTLTLSDVPVKSVSERLTRYPEDMLSAPIDQRQASLRVRPGGPALQ
jgi:nickel/cobalt transporter (NicO) family protein